GARAEREEAEPRGEVGNGRDHDELGKLDRRLCKDRNPGRAGEQHQIVAVGDTVDRRQRQPSEPVADLPDIERLFHPLLERMPLDIAKLRRRYQQVQPNLAGKVADVVGKAVAQEFRLAAGLYELVEVVVDGLALLAE